MDPVKIDPARIDRVEIERKMMSQAVASRMGDIGWWIHDCTSD